MPTRYLDTDAAAQLLGMTERQLDDHLFRGLADYAPMRPLKIGQQRLFTERQLLAYRDNGLSAWPHCLKSERVYGSDRLMTLVRRLTRQPYSYDQLRYAVKRGQLTGLMVGKTRLFPYAEARQWLRTYHCRK